jgi:hypothetical protein
MYTRLCCCATLHPSAYTKHQARFDVVLSQKRTPEVGSSFIDRIKSEDVRRLPISCFAHSQQSRCYLRHRIGFNGCRFTWFEIAQIPYLFQHCTTQSMTNNKKPRRPELIRFKVLCVCASRDLIFTLGWYTSVIGVRV